MPPRLSLSGLARMRQIDPICTDVLYLISRPRFLQFTLNQHTLAFLVMKVGDRLAGLAFELGEKTGHVLGGVPLLFRLGERLRERSGEGVEPLQETLHQLGRNLRLSQHLFQPKFIAAFHDRIPSRIAPSRKGMMQNIFETFKGEIQ